MPGTTNYPSALDNDTTLPVDKTDDTLTATDHPAHHNNLAAAVRAVETELGTDPSGANYSTVKDALVGKVDFSPTAEQVIQGTGDIVGLTVKATAAQNAQNVFQMRLNNNAIGAFIDKNGNFSAQGLKIAGTALAASHLSNGVTGTGAVVLASAIAGLAALASPTFTGTPVAPTAAVDTSTTQLATTAFVLNQAASATPLMDGAAVVGTSTRFARGDHVHPTDTSRQPILAATSVAGLGTETNGKVGLLHIATLNPDPLSLLVVYDSTQAAWLSAPVTHLASGATSTVTASVTNSIVAYVWVPADADAYSAGMRTYVRIRFWVSSNQSHLTGASYSFGAKSVVSSGAARDAVFANYTLINSGNVTQAAEQFIDTGWQPLPALSGNGSTILALALTATNASQTLSIFSPTIETRRQGV